MTTKIDPSEPTALFAAMENDELDSSVGTRSHLNLHHFSPICMDKLSDLKDRITRRLASEYGDFLNHNLIRLAVQEADSLSATTPFPALFLPQLAEEKVRAASEWSQRQAAIRGHAAVLAA